MISTRKKMPIVVWNPHRFHLVNALPKKQKWTSQYDNDHILPEMGAARGARD
jgi:hypothetical protein